MQLSSNVIKKFVEVTNKDKKTGSNEGTVFGTIVESGGVTYVRIDGSEILTPVERTVVVKDGQRVVVMIKDHTATVTGNLTDQAASSVEVGDLGVKIKGMVTIESLKNGTTVIDGGCIQTGSLNADLIKSGSINASLITSGKLNADLIKTGTLTADLIKIGILAAKDPDVFSLDLSKGTFSMQGSGRFMSDDGKTYITIEDNGIILYSRDPETEQMTSKIRIALDQAMDPTGSFATEYPYILLGNAGSAQVGLIKKFWNGLWLGNSKPMNLTGSFEGMEGASGIFVDTANNKTYLVEGTNMRDVYTGGAAIAKFA